MTQQNIIWKVRIEKGFLQRLNSLLNGFKLIDKAKSTEKDSKNNINNTSDGNGYESMWKQNQLKQ
jgi:hypothetical protein